MKKMHRCGQALSEGVGRVWGTDLVPWARNRNRRDKARMIPVVDVFAGPGGLNEGFSSVEHLGRPVFDVVASFEMEKNAVETLALRSAIRELSRGGCLPRSYQEFLAGNIAWRALIEEREMDKALRRARAHVHMMELGPSVRETAAGFIASALGGREDWVLIGGPPCQAYSLVGRSRRKHDPEFLEDKKHFLYREYLDIIQRFKPAVFVMENVKGLLSAGHHGFNMFNLIMSDLAMNGRYEIRSFVVPDEHPQPKDFVIRAERYGIPQRRHRVILLGIRNDLGNVVLKPLHPQPAVTVRHAIHDMARLNPRVTRTTHSQETVLSRARDKGVKLAAALASPGRGIETSETGTADELRSWLRRHDVPITQHEARGHMESDLVRYTFLATLAQEGRSFKVQELPEELRPKHKNVKGESTPFTDRFKVQKWDAPGSTVASHISKDGHYYIHPDPGQSRSLTVREAARLQTFPDDYFFCGTRTKQYHQVGNAVPPLLAFKIAERVADLLGERTSGSR